MCGIAGFNLVDADIGRIDTARAIEAMGLALMSRGTDATGVMTVTQSDRWKLVKDHTDAKQFFKDHPGIGNQCRGALVHTRAATQGSRYIWGNNHPIIYNKIIGIHNGMLWNDDDIFDVNGWKREAMVDSEAIFASLYHDDTAVKALERIDGSYAVAWFDTTNLGVLHMARGNQSPLIWALTVAGSVFFASTEAALEAGMRAAGMSVSGKFSDYARTMGQGLYLAHDRDGRTEPERLIFTDFDGDAKNATFKPGRLSRRPDWYSKNSWEDWEFASGRVSPPKTEPVKVSELLEKIADNMPDDIIDGQLTFDPFDSPNVGDMIEMYLDDLQHTLRGEIIAIDTDGLVRVGVMDEIEIDLTDIDFRILKGV